MKTKTVGISILLLVCSVLLAWYAFGSLYEASFNGLDVYLASPANNTFTSNASVIFNCTAATNETTGIGNITLWLAKEGQPLLYNRTNATSSGGITNMSAVFNQVILSEGLWFWNCRGANTSKASITNSSNTSGVVIIDLTAPVISFNSSTLANNSYLNPNTTSYMITLAADISELWPANLSYNVWMANGTALMTNFTVWNASGASGYNLTMTSLRVNLSRINLTQSDGPGGTGVLNDTLANAVLLIEVNVTDRANHTTSLRRTLTTDSIDPVLSITAPFNGTTWKANATSLAIRFNISQSDTNLNASRAIYRFGAATGLSNTSFTQNTSELVNTSQTITLSMSATNQYGVNNTIIHFITKDKAGRETVNYTRINLDFAPVIALSYPTSGVWATEGLNILFNFTAINNDTSTSSLDSCALWGNLVGANASYIVNKTLNSSVSNAVVASMGSYNGTTVPVNISLNLLEGNYTWAVWCNDTTGNSIYTANRTLYVDLTAPTPSVSAAESTGRSTIGLSDTVTLTCTATDTIGGVSTGPTASVSKVTKPDGTTITSPGTSLTNIDQTGTYTVYCTATDTAGYTATTTTTFTALYSSQGGVSNGGGPGVVKTQTVTIPGILPGGPKFVKLADPQEYALMQIEIDVLNAVTNVKITVKKLIEKPADATSEAAETAGDVYKYIEVLKENMKDADIKKASMTFQVPKSWLKDKGATKEQVTLKRLKGASWEKLATTIADEDDDNVYYKASAPGLSYFAVVIEEKPAVVTEEEAAEIEAEQAAEEAEELAAAAAPSRTGLWITLAALIVVIAGAAAAVIYFKKKR